MRLPMLCLAAGSLVAAQPAAAERWYAVGGTDDGRAYVDADSVRIDGDVRYARSYTRYAAPIGGEVYAGTIVAEFDCANRWFRTLEYSYFGARREHLGTEPSETIDQRRVPEPGSINDGIFGFVCFGRGGDAVVDPWDHAGQSFAK
jgi:hypothetical protein